MGEEGYEGMKKKYRRKNICIDCGKICSSERCWNCHVKIKSKNKQTEKEKKEYIQNWYKRKKEKNQNYGKKNICIDCESMCYNKRCWNCHIKKKKNESQTKEERKQYRREYHNQNKKATCIICGKPAPIKYCSLLCSWTGKCGKNNVNWSGGTSPLNKKLRQTRDNTKWRIAVFKRDNYKCCVCSSRTKIEAHHIIPFYFILIKNNITSIKDAKRCKELWNINNGATLCRKCHNFTSSIGNPKNRSKILFKF